MIEHDDFEAGLKVFDHDPAPRVRHAVLTAHRAQHGRPPVWRRGIPVYAVVALLALAVGLTWMAGQEHAGGRVTAAQIQPAAIDTAFVWASAVRDQI